MQVAANLAKPYPSNPEWGSGRWWGILGLATQRVVARAISLGAAADLAEVPLEPVPGAADWVA